jgi:ribosomal protein S18 acetylase RimI-like enzyme
MIAIRTASQNDLALLVSMGRETFVEAFASENTPENMEAYLHTAFTDEKIKQELKETESQFFLAYDGSTPVGYAKVRVNDEVKGLLKESAVELERIYVISAYQGRKIGVALLEKCIEFGKQNNFFWIWLGVWENNTKAQQFYLKWGFEKFGEHPFKMGSDVQTDWLMKKRIE